MMAINLPGLYPQEYEHPDDAEALDALQHTAGLETLVRTVSSWGMERLLRIQFTGSFLRVTPDNFPELYKIFITARDRLALPITPDFYVKNEEEINAFTTGVEKPIIVVNSGTIDKLDDDELLFIISHEMGHIKSGHVLYYQIAEYLPVIGSIIGDLTLNIGNVLSMGLQIALLHWKRTSELTADRAGLLGCQQPEVSSRSMMKLAGLPHKYAAKANVEDFIQQAEQFESFDTSKSDRILKFLSISSADHPWTVMRAKELLRWVDTGGYDRVLRAPRALPKEGTGLHYIQRFCDVCGAKAPPDGAFCSLCGARLPDLK